MTKHGHKTYNEFCEEWNLTEEEAMARLYEETKDNWIHKRRELFYDIAIGNIIELIQEAGDRPSKEVYNDIVNVIDNLHDRIKNNSRW